MYVYIIILRFGVSHKPPDSTPILLTLCCSFQRLLMITFLLPIYSQGLTLT